MAHFIIICVACQHVVGSMSDIEGLGFLHLPGLRFWSTFIPQLLLLGFCISSTNATTPRQPGGYKQVEHVFQNYGLANS